MTSLRKGKAARELLVMLDAYNADYFEESQLTSIRSKYKVLTGESKRIEAVEIEGTEMEASAGSRRGRGRSRTPPRVLDAVKDRELIEDW